MNPSIVAMLGLIMPAPLLMPVNVDQLAIQLNGSPKRFGRSVGRHDAFSSAQPIARLCVRKRGIQPCHNALTGQGFHRSHRRKWQHLLCGNTSLLAKASQVVRARARPSAPVPALALPVLTNSAEYHPSRSGDARGITTGAAQKRLVVNTAATEAPSSSNITQRSLRPCVYASLGDTNP